MIIRSNDELMWWLLVKNSSGGHTKGSLNTQNSDHALPDTGHVP